MHKYIPVSEPSITEEDVKYVTNAVKSGWVSSQGEYLQKFETDFANFIGTKYALATSNGTVALHLALVTLGIKGGDEVIMPDFTFIATANAVAYTGAKPVMVDIEQDTWCMSPKSLRQAITSKTKAIIPVHIYGHPANMDEILQIAKENNLYVIEDAAEAHGAIYKGKKVGSLAECGIFSFYGNKIITTGEGGIITTNDELFYERAKFLRDHAMDSNKRYWHKEIGFNYRMTNMQAALGFSQLNRINELIDKKRQIFFWYKKNLNDIEGIQLNPEKDWAKNVYWMVCLILEGDNAELRRDELLIKLKENNIDSRPFFYPITKMPMYYNKIINKIAYDISKRGISLPSSAILNEEDVKYVTDTLKILLQN